MTQLTQPAFPIMPIQDNFKRLIVPVPGINKLEHFALEIFKAKRGNNWEGNDNDLMEHSIEKAITFLTLLEEKTKKLNDEKNNEVPIFNH